MEDTLLRMFRLKLQGQRASVPPRRGNRKIDVMHITIDEIVPRESRLAVAFPEEALDSLLLEEFLPPCRAVDIGWDLRRQHGGRAGLGCDTFVLMASYRGETPRPVDGADKETWREARRAWLDAQWASFDRPGLPTDWLLIDVADEAVARGWQAPPDVAAAVEALRDIAAPRYARRVAA